MPVHVIDGKREGSYIYHCGDGFYYHFNNMNEYALHEGNRSVLYLRCAARHKRHCQGTAKIEIMPDHEIIWEDLERHVCHPNLDHHGVLQLRQHILRESRQVDGPRGYEQPAELVRRIGESYNPHIAAQVTPSRMKSAIQRSRSALYPPVPITLHRLGECLSDARNFRISTTLDGTDNTFSGVANTPNHTSLVFISRRMQRFMRRVTLVFCDGTFSSRPNVPASAQVIQISTVCRNTVIPLAQVITTSKEEIEYVAVLNYIRHLIPQFQPQKVMCDYEVGLQNAWGTVYPNAQILGCYWHYCRAIFKKARALGLVRLMNENRFLKSTIRSACAIPLLPHALMERGLISLMTEATQRGYIEQLSTFFNYMITTWLSGPHFGRLSVFREKHRTNNVSESCNRLLKWKTGAHRPGLWQFLHAIKRMERDTFMTIRTILMGLPANRKRRVSAVNNDRRIKNYSTLLLEGTISINRFLHVASTRAMRVFNNIIE